MKKAALLVLLLAIQSHAATIQDEQLQRANDRAKALEDLLPKSPNVNLEDKSLLKAAPNTLSVNEPNCFLIKDVELEGDSAALFKPYLKDTLGSLRFDPRGQCLGAGSA